jgi:uncharacterized membrane protein YfcA
LSGLEIIYGVGAGLLAGFAGSMLGLGGGFIMVPVLHIGFGLEMEFAVGTSLAIMIFTAASSAAGYWRQGRIDTRLARFLVITAIPGVVCGALIADAVDRTTLKIIFGAALSLAAVRMVTGKKALASHGFKKHVLPCRIVDREGTVFEYNVNLVLTMIFAGVAGLSAGLLGIGGGIINVPVLTFAGLPIHLAVATSCFIIIFNAITGAVSHAFLANINYGLAAAIVPGAIIGAQLGAMAGKRVKPDKLRLILGIALLLLALRMIAKALDWMV